MSLHSHVLENVRLKMIHLSLHIYLCSFFFLTRENFTHHSYHQNGFRALLCFSGFLSLDFYSIKETCWSKGKTPLYLSQFTYQSYKNGIHYYLQVRIDFKSRKVIEKKNSDVTLFLCKLDITHLLRNTCIYICIYIYMCVHVCTCVCSA